MSTRSLARAAAAAALILGAASAAAAPAALTALPTAAATDTAAPAAHPDFSGTWHLDPRSSDDPAKVFGGAEGPGGRDGQRPGGDRRTLPRPSMDPDRTHDQGPGFVGSGRSERGRAEAMAGETSREAAELEIFQAGDEFNLTDGMQVSQMLRIGGEPTELLTPRGSLMASATWEGEILAVTERDPKGEVRRTRQFSLSPDRSVLTVRDIRHRPGKDGDLALTMIYRHEASTAAPGGAGKRHQ